MLGALAEKLTLGSLLEEVRHQFGDYELIAHWQQGEFHHDIVIQLPKLTNKDWPQFVVIATNCNGGVKEVLSFSELPERGALWHWRCPTSTEFQGELPNVVDRWQTVHWFDPCQLLGDDARSELRPEFRKRQAGGGWEQK
jgi:hypothetical protein